MWPGRAQSRCIRGKGRAQVRCRCCKRRAQSRGRRGRRHSNPQRDAQHSPNTMHHAAGSARGRQVLRLVMIANMTRATRRTDLNAASSRSHTVPPVALSTLTRAHPRAHAHAHTRAHTRTHDETSPCARTVRGCTALNARGLSRRFDVHFHRSPRGHAERTMHSHRAHPPRIRAHEQTPRARARTCRSS